MANTFFGLSIAKSGLYAYQAAINTTGHNSSNVDTEGYTRQKTVRSASDAISVSSSFGMQGTGVDVTAVEQIRDEYYDRKYWKNCSVYGNYYTKSYYMQSIQNYISEVNAQGTTKALGDVASAALSLYDTPDNTTKRTQLAENSKSFSEYMNFLYTSMASIQEECNQDIRTTADEINSIAQQIASLNKQISTIEIGGDMANDLRDARNLLLDQLSELGNITVTEPLAADGVGTKQFIVRLDGKTLVDTYEFNTLVAVPNETKVNQNDIDGLYTLKWSNGQPFDSSSLTLGGKLQALFEMRDGNNNTNFHGKVDNVDPANKTITVTGTNVEDISKLNIPDEKGKIVIASTEYTYESFEVAVDAAGHYTYTFHLTDTPNAALSGGDLRIGDKTDYKGIPYYMGKLNEFVRTFAKSFNDIHKNGTDLEHHQGEDFFTGNLGATGTEFVFTNASSTNFSSLPVDNGTGKVVASYYNITAANFTVNASILENPKKIACAEGGYDSSGAWIDGVKENGVSDATNIEKLAALFSDENMFKQGTPQMYLETFTGEIGVDCKAAISFTENQEDILEMVVRQRMSISGVDSDEEAMDLMKFKNAYNLCSKVFSTMNEIYDKLINQTGV